MNGEYIELIEKIGRAKLLLERGKLRHTNNCIVETSDPTAYTSPSCDCRAKQVNELIKDVIEELTIEPRA